jgi:hypothetical protein
MLLLGKLPYETAQINVVLSSAASVDVFANNTPVRFANMLADEIVRSASTEGVYVRVRSLAVARSLSLSRTGRYGNDPVVHRVVHVLLHQLDGQAVGGGVSPLLAVLDARKLAAAGGGGDDVDGSECGQYLFLTFPQAPFLKLRDDRLLYLRVSLTTVEGEPVIAPDDAPPTLLHLELNARAGAMQEFTMTSMSHPPEVPGLAVSMYPNNMLTDFTSNLPRAANMIGWEAAIASFSLPPHLNGADKVYMVVFVGAENATPEAMRADEDAKYQFSCNLEEAPSVQMLYDKIREDMANSALMKDKVRVDKVIVPDLTQKMVVGAHPPVKTIWRIKNSQKDKKLIVVLNRAMSLVLGHGYVNHDFAVAKAETAAAGEGTEEEVVVATGATMTGAHFSESLFGHICPPDVCFAQCDLLEPTVVGNAKSHTMGILPLKRMSGSKDDSCLYEPRHLTFFNIKDQDVGFFRFNLVRPDGTSFTLLPKLVDRTKMSATGGAMLTLRIRPRMDDGAVGYYRPRKLPRTFVGGGGFEGAVGNFLRDNEGYI